MTSGKCYPTKQPCTWGEPSTAFTPQPPAVKVAPSLSATAPCGHYPEIIICITDAESALIKPLILAGFICTSWKAYVSRWSIPHQEKPSTADFCTHLQTQDKFLVYLLFLWSRKRKKWKAAWNHLTWPQSAIHASAHDSADHQFGNASTSLGKQCWVFFPTKQPFTYTDFKQDLFQRSPLPLSPLYWQLRTTWCPST